MNTTKNTGSNVTIRSHSRSCSLNGNEPGDAIETTRQFLWQREILNLSLRSIKVNNWSADNFEKTRQVNELYTSTSIQSCDTGQWLLFLIAVS